MGRKVNLSCTFFLICCLYFGDEVIEEGKSKSSLRSNEGTVYRSHTLMLVLIFVTEFYDEFASDVKNRMRQF